MAHNSPSFQAQANKNPNPPSLGESKEANKISERLNPSNASIPINTTNYLPAQDQTYKLSLKKLFTTNDYKAREVVFNDFKAAFPPEQIKKQAEQDKVIYHFRLASGAPFAIHHSEGRFFSHFEFNAPSVEQARISAYGELRLPYDYTDEATQLAMTEILNRFKQYIHKMKINNNWVATKIHYHKGFATLLLYILVQDMIKCMEVEKGKVVQPKTENAIANLINFCHQLETKEKILESRSLHAKHLDSMADIIALLEQLDGLHRTVIKLLDNEQSTHSKIDAISQFFEFKVSVAKPVLDVKDNQLGGLIIEVEQSLLHLLTIEKDGSNKQFPPPEQLINTLLHRPCEIIKNGNAVSQSYADLFNGNHRAFTKFYNDNDSDKLHYLRYIAKSQQDALYNVIKNIMLTFRREVKLAVRDITTQAANHEHFQPLLKAVPNCPLTRQEILSYVKKIYVENRHAKQLAEAVTDLFLALWQLYFAEYHTKQVFYIIKATGVASPILLQEYTDYFANLKHSLEALPKAKQNVFNALTKIRTGASKSCRLSHDWLISRVAKIHGIPPLSAMSIEDCIEKCNALNLDIQTKETLEKDMANIRRSLNIIHGTPECNDDAENYLSLNEKVAKKAKIEKEMENLYSATDSNTSNLNPDEVKEDLLDLPSSSVVLDVKPSASDPSNLVKNTEYLKKYSRSLEDTFALIQAKIHYFETCVQTIHEACKIENIPIRMVTEKLCLIKQELESQLKVIEESFNRNKTQCVQIQPDAEALSQCLSDYCHYAKRITTDLTQVSNDHSNQGNLDIYKRLYEQEASINATSKSEGDEPHDAQPTITNLGDLTYTQYRQYNRGTSPGMTSVSALLFAYLEDKIYLNKQELKLLYQMLFDQPHRERVSHQVQEDWNDLDERPATSRSRRFSMVLKHKLSTITKPHRLSTDVNAPASSLKFKSDLTNWARQFRAGSDEKKKLCHDQYFRAYLAEKILTLDEIQKNALLKPYNDRIRCAYLNIRIDCVKQKLLTVYAKNSLQLIAKESEQKQYRLDYPIQSNAEFDDLWPAEDFVKLHADWANLFIRFNRFNEKLGASAQDLIAKQFRAELLTLIDASVMTEYNFSISHFKEIQARLERLFDLLNVIEKPFRTVQDRFYQKTKDIFKQSELSNFNRGMAKFIKNIIQNACNGSETYRDEIKNKLDCLNALVSSIESLKFFEADETSPVEAATQILINRSIIHQALRSLMNEDSDQISMSNIKAIQKKITLSIENYRWIICNLLHSIKTLSNHDIKQVLHSKILESIKARPAFLQETENLKTLSDHVKNIIRLMNGLPNKHIYVKSKAKINAYLLKKLSEINHQAINSGLEQINRHRTKQNEKSLEKIITYYTTLIDAIPVAYTEIQNAVIELLDSALVSEEKGYISIQVEKINQLARELKTFVNLCPNKADQSIFHDLIKVKQMINQKDNHQFDIDQHIDTVNKLNQFLTLRDEKPLYQDLFDFALSNAVECKGDMDRFQYIISLPYKILSNLKTFQGADRFPTVLDRALKIKLITYLNAHYCDIRQQSYDIKQLNEDLKKITLFCNKIEQEFQSDSMKQHVYHRLCQTILAGYDPLQMNATYQKNGKFPPEASNAITNHCLSKALSNFGRYLDDLLLHEQFSENQFKAYANIHQQYAEKNSSLKWTMAHGKYGIKRAQRMTSVCQSLVKKKQVKNTHEILLMKAVKAVPCQTLKYVKPSSSNTILQAIESAPSRDSLTDLDCLNTLERLSMESVFESDKVQAKKTANQLRDVVAYQNHQLIRAYHHCENITLFGQPIQSESGRIHYTLGGKKGLLGSQMRIREIPCKDSQITYLLGVKEAIEQSQSHVMTESEVSYYDQASKIYSDQSVRQRFMMRANIDYGYVVDPSVKEAYHLLSQNIS